MYVNKEIGENVKSNFSGHYISHNDYVWFECKYALEMIFKENICLKEMNIVGKNLKNNIYKVGVCRACWKESPYVRFYWRLYSYDVCHKHDAELELLDLRLYHPEVGRLSLKSSGYSRLNLPDYWVIKEFLQFKKKSECRLGELLSELANSSDERRLWPKVVSFLEVRFQIEFNFDSVFEVLNLKILCGMDALGRLELVIDRLVDLSDASEKLVKISSLIFLKRYPSYSYRIVDFDSWAGAQAYAVSPLFEAYLFGANESLFFQRSRYGSRLKSPVYFSGFSDRMICQFIIDSGIFSYQELDNMYAGGKYYSTGWAGSSDSIQYSKYADYIELVDENIFERAPLSRSTVGF